MKSIEKKITTVLIILISLCILWAGFMYAMPSVRAAENRSAAEEGGADILDGATGGSCMMPLNNEGEISTYAANLPENYAYCNDHCVTCGPGREGVQRRVFRNRMPQLGDNFILLRLYGDSVLDQYGKF